MTMISRLGFKPVKKQALESELLLEVSNIAVVIPVKDNQKGIDFFLKEFFNIYAEDILPKEIIIIDNNSNPAIELKNKNFPIPVRVLKCNKMGPASARNLGVKHTNAEWILFTDSDCVPTDSMLKGYLKVQNGSLGYAGNVKAYKKDLISEYYEQQEILIPPKVYEHPVGISPDYLITANCLVWRRAFEKVGGFNEEIRIAGGEDIDLGFRLRSVGKITYAFESLVMHNFQGGLAGFRERFRRYGYGNKMISKLYNLDLRPKMFKPNKPGLLNYILAFLQFIWLTNGYFKSDK